MTDEVQMAINTLNDSKQYFQGRNWSISYNNIAYAIDLAIQALRLMQTEPWIPVSEKLPAYDEFVLVCTETKDVTICRWDEFRWHEVNESYFTVDVTHWMPLPEPPATEVR